MIIWSSSEINQVSPNIHKYFFLFLLDEYIEDQLKSLKRDFTQITFLWVQLRNYKPWNHNQPIKRERELKDKNIKT